MKIHMTYRLGLFFILSMSQAASADPVETPLQEILQAAIKNSKTVAAAHLQENVVEANIEIAKTGYLPRLDFQAVDSTGFAGSSGALGVSGLMGSPYRSGYAYGVVGTGTILDFGKTARAVESASKQTEAQKQETQITRLQAMHDALLIYFECSRARTLSEEWSEIANQAKIVGGEISKYVRTGQKSIVENLLVDSQNEEALRSVDDFRQRYQTTKQRLSILTGLSISHLECPSLNSKKLELFKTDLQASDRNILIKRAEKEVDFSKAKLSQAKSGYLPKIVGIASYGQLEDARLVNAQDYSLGVGFVFPLFDGLETKREVEKADIATQEKQMEVEAAKQTTEEAELKYDQALTSAETRMNHLENELNIGQRAMKLARTRYFNKEGSLVDLREALRNLSSIQAQLADAKAEYWSTRADKDVFNSDQ
jgi:outer membrane protein